MKINKKSIILPSLFFAMSGIGYAGTALASLASTELSVKEQKVIYAEQCAENDKIDGKCTQK
ncbi:hypothetical protein [Pseudomonas fitomaticsae]|jgi:hypothetical protein|uniref:Uncharacterized protein n=1 Tax=Pseudomonas fitomaticsae TaxID=2837969 RepID=A0ABY3Q8M5_9PSED|nr:hypothetical protein [Pseudomonas fitomaticsae]UFQ02461.1 hypothetical protein KJY40_12465 [Pseudomonas fitomaticsae]